MNRIKQVSPYVPFKIQNSKFKIKNYFILFTFDFLLLTSHRAVISVAIAAILSITTLKLDKVEANPITAPECRDVPSCVVTGTVVIGGVVYYIIRNTVTGVVRRVPAGQVHGTQRKKRSSMFPPEENGWVHMPRIPGGGYTLNQCVLLAAQLERERGGKWEPHFITVTPEEGRGHCDFSRREDY